MIALGVTWGGASLDGPMMTVAAGSLALVAIDGGVAGTARRRLQLQVEVSHVLPAFVPFAPVRACALDRAAAWAHGHEAAARSALERVDGACQMVLDLRGPPAEAGDPRAWLRQRAALSRVPEGLRRRMASASRAAAVRRSRTGAAVDFLVDRSRVAALRAAVAAACGEVDLRGWSGALVGPWPALSFHGLEAVP